MPMTLHDKELIAVAISVAAGCRPCTTYHLAQAGRQGASDDAIEKAVARAICVRNSASEGMRRHASGQPADLQENCDCQSAQLLDELIALGAALAVNCTENIATRLAAVQRLGTSREHLEEMLALVRLVRGQAVKHAEARMTDAGVEPQRCGTAPSGCC